MLVEKYSARGMEITDWMLDGKAQNYAFTPVTPLPLVSPLSVVLRFRF